MTERIFEFEAAHGHNLDELISALIALAGGAQKDFRRR